MHKFFTCCFTACVLLINTAAAQWSQLGGTNSMQNNYEILALCSDKAGNIYAAGDIQDNNGHYYVDFYNGSVWSALGALSANSQILTLCTDAAGNIYAAGHFTNDSGSYYVAKYNGSTWSELGGNNTLKAKNSIETITSDAAGNIYAAGYFKNSSGFYYVAKFDGNTWSELGGANALAADLYLLTLCADKQGNIYTAGSLHYVAEFKDSVWSELGGANGLNANGTIYSIAADTAGNIYAAGAFTDDSSKPYIAKWNDTAWSKLGNIPHVNNNASFGPICIDSKENIYVVGDFNNRGWNYIAKWNGSYWQGLDSTHFASQNGSLGAMCTDSAGNVYTVGAEVNNYYNVEEFSTAAYEILYDTTCPSMPYYFNGAYITQAGTYIDTIPSPYGYDSIITLHLAYRIDTALRAQFTMQPAGTPHLWYALNQCTGLPPLEYVWTWGDGSLASTYPTPDHVYDSAGYYTICVTVSDSMGCAATYCDSSGYYFKNESSAMVYVDVVNAIPTGISLVGPGEFNLYPNPNNGLANLVTTNMQGSEYTISDITGRLISTQIINSDSEPIHLAVATGLYVLQVKGYKPVMFQVTR